MNRTITCRAFGPLYFYLLGMPTGYAVQVVAISGVYVQLLVK